MEYTFQSLEKKWRDYWKKNQVYKTENNSAKPKCYVLDMFPYPSGAGLHVGHPLGYIASDIYARYKRLKGYNVLHPMGFDAFGLPAEQYAIETGRHPADTTRENIARYREQLDNIGFCYDWDRMVCTSDPAYYRWTQWIFTQLFHSWYDTTLQKARSIHELVEIFEQEGNKSHPCPGDPEIHFDATHWKHYTHKEQRQILMHYRLAYLGYADVWWCEGLGTVLANDEVVNGVSERGGFPVERKKMRQWFLRITSYADRLLEGLEKLEWSEAMKEMQRNWIGKSKGAEMCFDIVSGNTTQQVRVFTTRPDTIYGVDFLVLAPEHALISEITTEEQQKAVEKYQEYVKSRSERERMSEVKQITGAFTGAYAIHPLSGKKIPVWISEYVLAGYGTGAIMAVPSGDSRDHAFAKHFDIPITNIFGEKYQGDEAYTQKDATLTNSDILDGLSFEEATQKILSVLEEKKLGKVQINYKLRDAGFSRQRYWGEPFPVIFKDDIPYTLDEPELDISDEMRKLPLELPEIQGYKPGKNGEGPLSNLTEWMETPAGKRESSTMPGYAGSSWYFLRYMDPHNAQELVGKDAASYWKEVDVYIGGTEHAVGHLLYSRMWTKFLYDKGIISFDEPFKMLINQGMIQGSSRLVYRLDTFKDKEQNLLPAHPVYVSHEIAQVLLHPNDTTKKAIAHIAQQLSLPETPATPEIKISEWHIDVQFVEGIELNMAEVIKNKPAYAQAQFITQAGVYYCGTQVEKMSKSKYNVVNPDDIVAQYGADTFRMYEMFLGPVEVSKPWDTKGIEGVHRFLKKFWRLYADEKHGWVVTEEIPSEEELKILHRTIHKLSADIEKFAFNTAVSQLMITVNELTNMQCHKRAILEPLTILLAPFAPHMAEELWQVALGHKETVTLARFPEYDEKYLKDDSFVYPVAINGKTRTECRFSLEATQQEIEETILANEIVQKWMEGKKPKKVIYVKGRMINVVV